MSLMDTRYYFDVNDSHNMLNWVYEEHYNMTCVRCEGYSVDDYHGAWFGGYWNTRHLKQITYKLVFIYDLLLKLRCVYAQRSLLIVKKC